VHRNRDHGRPAVRPRTGLALAVLAATAGATFSARADDPQDVIQLRARIAQERAALDQHQAALDAQRRELDAQQRRLDVLGADVLGTLRASGADPDVIARVAASQSAAAPASSPAPGVVGPVGEAPETEKQAPQIAVLGDMGGIITKRGQITLEPSVDYTHADSNRALFRGIELVEAVLVGVFDINEVRQDAVTPALGARYGITDKFEAGVRVPFVHRADRTVLAPILGSNNPAGSNAGVQDFPAHADNIGDVEATLRYQLNNGRGGWPFLIANLQAVMPTGTNPFKVKRDVSGAPLEAATGSGFWGLSPTLTAIMPSDPAVLFGTIGYTRNFGRNENALIGSTKIDRVKPGDALLGTVGIGLSVNERTSFNLGYAHTWAFGTTTTMRLEQTSPTGALSYSLPFDVKSRDLQLGRYLFGVTYRVNEHTTVNWAVEVGATNDSPSIHTSLRIPLTF
jgi:hypothetical protein